MVQLTILFYVISIFYSKILFQIAQLSVFMFFRLAPLKTGSHTWLALIILPALKTSGSGILWNVLLLGFACYFNHDQIGLCVRTTKVRYHHILCRINIYRIYTHTIYHLWLLVLPLTTGWDSVCWVSPLWSLPFPFPYIFWGKKVTMHRLHARRRYSPSSYLKAAYFS